MSDGNKMNWIPIAAVGDLSADRPKQVKVGEEVIGLYRIGDEVFALADICSHQFAYLTDGYVEDCVVECPLHQALFDIRTGRVLEGPARKDLRSFPTRIVGDQVFVAIEPLAEHSGSRQ